jgi:hypothetical protein
MAWQRRICHKLLLSGNLPWHGSVESAIPPATRPPGWLSAIPPLWAILVCWYETTSLVYPFGISTTPSRAPACTYERESISLEPLAFAILYGRGRIRFLESALRDCLSSLSRVVFHPSRAVLPTAVFIAVYFDRSSPTLSSTMLLLRLHLQANGMCDVFLFGYSSCSTSTCLTAICFHSSYCLVHLVYSSYMC